MQNTCSTGAGARRSSVLQGACRMGWERSG